MIIYFAGSGRKPEDSERICSEDNDQWGVLLSYKDQQTKDNKGSKRFQKFYENNVSHNKSFSKR